MGTHNALRGRPEHIVQRVPDLARIASYGLRENRTRKGPGYFGEVAHTDDLDLYVTELPSRLPGLLDVFERPLLIPLIVPALTREELAHLVDGGDATVEIKQKAVQHARERLAHNQSPFATVMEIIPLPEGTEWRERV